jgi:pre-mRNA-processing factor 40
MNAAGDAEVDAQRDEALDTATASWEFQQQRQQQQRMMVMMMNNNTNNTMMPMMPMMMQQQQPQMMMMMPQMIGGNAGQLSAPAQVAMMMNTGAGAGVPLPPPPPRQEQVWTAHEAPDKRKYYYNTQTKKSTYEKPRELYTERELFVDENTKWKQTYDKQTNKFYYYNRETKVTQWDEPKEFREVCEMWDHEERKKNSINNNIATNTNDEKVLLGMNDGSGVPKMVGGTAAVILPTIPNNPTVSNPQQNNNSNTHNMNYVPQTNADSNQESWATEEERKNAFNKLLDDINMPTSGTFEQFAQLASSDARFNALKKNGERRNCFNTFRSKKLKAEKEELKEIEKRKRVAFKNGLEDCRVKYEITSKSKIIRDSTLERNLLAQQWFTNIESFKERDIMFREFCSGLNAIERKEKLNKREQTRELFKNLLLEKKCNFDWQWRRDVMNNPIVQNDTRAVHCDRQDQLTVFSELFKSFEEKEIDTMNRDNAIRFREERKNRERFSETLKELVENKILTPRTIWGKFKKERLESTASFGMCNGNVSGSTPRELFDDELIKLEEKMLENANRLEKFIKEEDKKGGGLPNPLENFAQLLDEKETTAIASKLPAFDDLMKILIEYCEKYENKELLKTTIFSDADASADDFKSLCEVVADKCVRIQKRKKRKLRDAIDDFEDALYSEMKLFDEVLHEKTYKETKKAFQSSSWWTKCSQDFAVSDAKLQDIFEDIKTERLKKIEKKSSKRTRSRSRSRSRSRDNADDDKRRVSKKKSKRANESPESGEL